MYAKAPDAAELALAGLKPEDMQSVVDVWPENHNVVMIFQRMRRRWIHGFNGPVSIDVSCVPLYMRAAAVPESELMETLDGLAVMEEVALEEMYRA